MGWGQSEAVNTVEYVKEELLEEVPPQESRTFIHVEYDDPPKVCEHHAHFEKPSPGQGSTSYERYEPLTAPAQVEHVEALPNTPYKLARRKNSSSIFFSFLFF